MGPKVRQTHSSQQEGTRRASGKSSGCATESIRPPGRPNVFSRGQIQRPLWSIARATRPLDVIRRRWGAF